MSIQLGRFNDIPLKIHWSWTALFLGIIAVIGFVEGIQTGILYGVGIVALFFSVILHEFMHSYTASLFGYDTDEIVLYPLGGMSKIEELPTEPQQEFLIAFMGPVTNFFIAGVVWSAYSLIGPLDTIILGRELTELVNYFVFLNVVLGLFNALVPAIPMDGGRLLRSILGIYYPFPKATRIAVSVSKVIAVLMGLIGLAFDPWLLLIAFFVYIASSSELEESLTRYILEDVPLSEVPKSEVVEISPDIVVTDLLERMLKLGQKAFLVRDGGSALGVVTLSDIQKVPEGKRSSVRVQQIMTPDILTIASDSTARDALQMIREREVGQIFVEEHDQITGMLTRSDVIKFVQIKSLQKSSKVSTESVDETLMQQTTSN